ncbi:hypothetical protein [Fibrobacter sp. UWS1]|uniref:hypothetical protein n=1 Tax=Fibrobacter sp. UWS1 TaxID=1896220 RepID=UPI000BB1218E|nr:hypothetical protein [Fibrobacter sp. UWS1]PBC69271.1 hypothetical protein BGX14_1677 [Fibrobacter sp. UWS1]
MKTEKTRLQELAAGIEDDMKTTLGSLYKGISIETKGLPLHSQESISIHESGSYSAADIELRDSIHKTVSFTTKHHLKNDVN